MRKILSSVLAIGVVAVTVFAVTNAFFSDTETSTDNTFEAGAIDLLIDNTSYGFDWNDPQENNPTGEWRQNSANSWQFSDLTDQVFFSFVDLKPGDYGEDTISIHVNDNDAWACMAFNLTDTPENELVDPEAEAGDETEDEGELQNYLSFLFWWDDGDNVLEDDEEVIEELSDLPEQAFTGSWLAIADSENSGVPLEGDTDLFIGKGWCFGEIEATPVDQGNFDGPTPGNTGFTCNGEGDQNDAQTDSIVVDVAFHAIQSRNNEDFQCSSLEPLGGQRVGAALSSYEQPTDCTTTVDNVDDLEDAVNNGSEDDTICVEDGEYVLTEILHMDLTGMTLASLNGPTATSTITGGIFVDASDVTITGFIFDGHDFMGASENAAIYVHNENGQGTGTSLTGTTITHNIFDAPVDAQDEGVFAKGIVTEIGSASAIASGVSIMHNRFDGWRQGIFYNTANHETAFNDFYNNDVGVANDGPHSSSIHHNDFEDNELEAVGVAPDATASTSNDGELTVNINNLTPADAGNNVNWFGSSVFAGADVDAEDNWWDGEAEGDRTNDTDEVDTEPAAGSAYPEN